MEIGMNNQHGIGSWVLGGVMGIMALLGLILAAYAQERAFYTIGLALFVFSCGFIFFLIKHAFDNRKK